MSQINHPIASAGRGSTEISQAKSFSGEVHGDTGVNTPTATRLRTLQEINEDGSLT